MSKKYEINRPGETCLMCGKSLDHIERHRSALSSDDENQVLLRYDYCSDCWETVKDQPFFCNWITRRVIKNTESERAQRQNLRERACRIFLETLQADASNRSARLYILAHLLLRLRVLKWLGHEILEDTGERILVFEDIRSHERVVIPHVRLNEEELSEAQRFVDEIVKMSKSGKASPPMGNDVEEKGESTDDDTGEESDNKNS